MNSKYTSPPAEDHPVNLPAARGQRDPPAPAVHRRPVAAVDEVDGSLRRPDRAGRERRCGEGNLHRLRVCKVEEDERARALAHAERRIRASRRLAAQRQLGARSARPKRGRAPHRDQRRGEGRRGRPIAKAAARPLVSGRRGAVARFVGGAAVGPEANVVVAAQQRGRRRLDPLEGSAAARVRLCAWHDAPSRVDVDGALQQRLEAASVLRHHHVVHERREALHDRVAVAAHIGVAAAVELLGNRRDLQIVNLAKNGSAERVDGVDNHVADVGGDEGVRHVKVGRIPRRGEQLGRRVDEEAVSAAVGHPVRQNVGQLGAPLG
mmetsp:Transcript_36014/g.119273  ORF Transcript_36014/g.119273 Transcript_36014/m.119273 type:complete len:322 (+) Transcript_36014:40-1005(+)